MGEGGFGVVYEVEHIELKKKFALKVLNRELSQQSVMIERLKREAIATSKINHPNIVSVTDFGTTVEGQVYYVMEYLEGKDLAEILHAQKTISISRAIPILASICHALEASHRIGIVHRDLKPENIVLVQREDVQSGVKRDFVKILDFGLAKVVEGASRPRLSVEGLAMGTPGYIAPEAVQGKIADHRADIYSLGCIAFEMFAGRPVFTGAPLAVVMAHCHEPAPLVSTCAPGARVPEQMERLIARCLQKDPAKRFGSCQEVLDNLRSLAEELISPEGRTRVEALRTRKGPEAKRWWEDASFTDIQIGVPNEDAVDNAPRSGGFDDEEATIRRDYSEFLANERRVVNEELELGGGAPAAAPVDASAVARPPPAPEPPPPPPPPPAAAATAVDTQPLLAPRRIVVVDGDSGLAERLQRELAPHNWAVSVEPQGKQAVETIRKNPPDVILLCVELADIVGYVVCNRLKSDHELSRVPLILMSAVATEETWRQHGKLATRADDYLCKPFAVEHLLKKLAVLTDPEHRARYERSQAAALKKQAKNKTTRMRAARTGRWWRFAPLALLGVCAGAAVISYLVLRRSPDETGALVITFTPATARVRVGGVAREGAGGTRVLNGLPAGSNTLELSHPECTTLVKEVSVRAGQVTVAKVELQCGRGAKGGNSLPRPAVDSPPRK
jgi:serine/threonine protein kinase/CheY-like chemotaxis protein